MGNDSVLARLLAEIGKRCPKRQLPDSYLVFDTETSGTDIYKCRILQAGFCFVEDGKVIDKIAFLIKRGPETPIDPRAIAVHHITHDMLEAEGVEPREAIEMVRDNFQQWREKGYMFMGHNMIAFDAPLFELEAKLLGVPWCFEENEVIDTGMLAKGAQLGMFFRSDDETLRSFYKRVAEVRRRGVYWSLDRYCINAYDLAKYGIEKDKMHDAGADCEATHYLFHEMKARSRGD